MASDQCKRRCSRLDIEPPTSNAQHPSFHPMSEITSPSTRPPLRTWALELARRWNAGAHSVYVLHGNIFDLFPVPDANGVGYAPLKSFLARRFFPDRGWLLFYDIGDGLTFGSPEMQKKFFEW